MVELTADVEGCVGVSVVVVVAAVVPDVAAEDVVASAVIDAVVADVPFSLSADTKKNVQAIVTSKNIEELCDHVYVPKSRGGSRNARRGGAMEGPWRQMGAQLTTDKLAPAILVMQ